MSAAARLPLEENDEEKLPDWFVLIVPDASAATMGTATCALACSV